MKAWFAKLHNADLLSPACESASKLVRNLGKGEGVQMQAIRIRSLDWHKMYFGCCRAIGHNQDPQRDENSIDYELRIRAGHYDVMIVDGMECRFAKRIAFEKMTPDQWAQLWPSLDLAMQEHFGFDFKAWKAAA